jgi:anti-sigma factor (TIGR02949 family)
MGITEIRGCEDALRLVAAYLDRELGGMESEQVRRHLQVCRSCYGRAEFEKRLRARLAELGHEPVRPELAGRVQSLIRTFTVARGA